MNFSFPDFKECFYAGIVYLPITIKVALISIVIGTFLSLIVSVLQFYKVPVISQILTVFFTIYRAIPMMVIMLIFHLIYVMYFNDIAKSLHLNLTVNDVGYYPLAYLIMTLGTMTGVNECFRGALSAVPKIQFEAAQSIGLSTIQTLRDIILPQMFPVAFPSYMANIIGVLKGVPLLSAIGVVEVMQGALIEGMKSYSFLETYTAIALIYVVFICIVTILFEIIENKIFVHQPTVGSK